jgi:putative Holliday junction resolvase
MRLLGLDIGAKRIGVAVSDATGTLARPVQAIAGFQSDDEALSMLARVIETLEADNERIEAVVIGMPSHLDGRPHEHAAQIRKFGEQLAARMQRRVAFEDERLSSREAESRLAQRVRDWRKRKALIDSAAAAVILQDYLDRRTAMGVEIAE